MLEIYIMQEKLCCVSENTECEVYFVSGLNKCRLLEMGFTRGTKIKVLQKSIKNGPIEIEIRNSKLAIRREEAANILVIVK